MIVSIFIGAFLIILGIFVRKNKLVWVLAGSREIKKDKYDMEGITKYIGNESIILGSGLIFLNFIDYAIGLEKFDLAVSVFVIVVIVIHMVGSKRFKLKNQ